MIRDTSTKAESFCASDRIFGAFDRESAELLLVVEAGSSEEARTFVDVVAPLVGSKRGCDLVVEPLEEIPAGVPTFLKAFFEAGKIGFHRGDAAPGPSTLQ